MLRSIITRTRLTAAAGFLALMLIFAPAAHAAELFYISWNGDYWSPGKADRVFSYSGEAQGVPYCSPVMTTYEYIGGVKVPRLWFLHYGNEHCRIN